MNHINIFTKISHTNVLNGIRQNIDQQKFVFSWIFFCGRQNKFFLYWIMILVLFYQYCLAQLTITVSPCKRLDHFYWCNMLTCLTKNNKFIAWMVLTTFMMHLYHHVIKYESRGEYTVWININLIQYYCVWNVQIAEGPLPRQSVLEKDNKLKQWTCVHTNE